MARRRRWARRLSLCTRESVEDVLPRKTSSKFKPEEGSSELVRGLSSAIMRAAPGLSPVYWLHLPAHGKLIYCCSISSQSSYRHAR